MIAAEDAAGMPGEVIEQAELGSSGGGELASHAELHGAGVNGDVLEGDGGGRGGALEAAEDSLDAGEELAGSERLGDVVVGSELEAEDALVFSRTRGEEDDGDGAQRGVVAETAADVESVAAGDHDVEKKERGRLALGVGDEICGGPENADAEAGSFEMV